jgi:hypothetical protein
MIKPTKEETFDDMQDIMAKIMAFNEKHGAPENELATIDTPFTNIVPNDSFAQLIESLGGTFEEVVNARTFCELVNSATLPDGSVDLMAIDNAPAVGYNGGVKCDVTSGPCNCGAWH